MVSLRRNAKYFLEENFIFMVLLAVKGTRRDAKLRNTNQSPFVAKIPFLTSLRQEKYHKNALLHTKMLTLCAKKTMKMNFSPRKYIAFRLGILHEYHNMNMLESRGNFVACITVFQISAFRLTVFKFVS